jgi:uncharacterized protein (TIGR03032 family)
VLRLDPVSGASTVIATLPGFTHGLAAYRGVLFVGLSKLRQKRGPQGLPIEAEGELMAGVAALDQATGEVLGILHFFNGVEEVFDVQVIPDIKRAEILAPEQWYRTSSVVTMEGGMWERQPQEPVEEANG